MNKQDYLNKILALCTEKQTELFNRMYPDGVSSKQISHATFQIENTLKNLNESNEELNRVIKESDEHKLISNGKVNDLINNINLIEKELVDANSHIMRLENPINIENNEVQERLNLLDALEAAGVDNWNGYGYALDYMRGEE